MEVLRLEAASFWPLCYFHCFSVVFGEIFGLRSSFGSVLRIDFGFAGTTENIAQSASFSTRRSNMFE